MNEQVEREIEIDKAIDEMLGTSDLERDVVDARALAASPKAWLEERLGAASERVKTLEQTVETLRDRVESLRERLARLEERVSAHRGV